MRTTTIRLVCAAALLAGSGCEVVAGLGDFTDAPAGTTATGGAGGTAGSGGTAGGGGVTGGGGTGGAAAVCGDGVINGNEACEPRNVGDATCASAGNFYAGELTCDGECAFDTSACVGPPSVPAPHTPMNNSYVGSMFVPGSRMPTFSWFPAELPQGGPSASIRYELEYSLSQDFGSPTLIDAGDSTSYKPADDLDGAPDAPVGARYFWHVRACVDMACSDFSPAWYVNVGRTPSDFDGDGYADVIGGAFTENGGLGKAYLYRSTGSQGPDDTDDGSADGPVGADSDGGYGNSITSGDYNGDGFADVVVAAWRYDPVGVATPFGFGRAYIHFGGTQGPFAQDPVEVGGDLCCELGNKLGPAGDVNGDGFDDLILGALYYPATFVYFGGAGATFAAAADVVLPGLPDTNNNTWFGLPAGSAGDLDGDGFAEIFVGEAHGTIGKAHLYRGRATFPDSPSPDVTLTNDIDNAWFGLAGGAAGDLNGDGYGDLLVGAPLTNNAYVYFGGPGPLDATPDGTLSGPAAGLFGELAGGAGDVDGDGYDDLLIGAKDALGQAGEAYLFRGGEGSSFDAAIDATFTGASGERAGFVCGGGDVNGDGFADVLVGAPSPGGATGGKVRVFAGGSLPLSTTPMVTLDPAGSATDSFGAALR